MDMKTNCNRIPYETLNYYNTPVDIKFILVIKYDSISNKKSCT